MEKFKTVEEAQGAYDALKKLFDKLGAEKTAVNAQLADATKVVEEMSEKLVAAESANPNVTAKVGKTTYRVNFGVMGKKKADVAKDAKLLAELVKVGSAALTEVK